MDLSLLSLIISAIAIVSTVCGWFVIHNMSRKRDLENQKKEMRISYLINAFRRIEDSVNRTDPDKLFLLESAIADIQLFGTKKQIELSIKSANDLAKNRQADNKPLLMDLRNDLRNELGLEPVTDVEWCFLRINDDTTKK